MYVLIQSNTYIVVASLLASSVTATVQSSETLATQSDLRIQIDIIQKINHSQWTNQIHRNKFRSCTTSIIQSYPIKSMETN